MRLRVEIDDRLGIAQEVLACLAERCLDLSAVEMHREAIHVDVPGLAGEAVLRLVSALSAVQGVRQVRQVALLPGVESRLRLEALLSAMSDPVFAVDAAGVVKTASVAALRMVGVSPLGRSLESVLGLPATWRACLNGRPSDAGLEVALGDDTFMLDVLPLHESASAESLGALVVLRSPGRLGETLTALQRPAATGGGMADLTGDSSAMRQLKAKALRVATVDAPLLITGETGVGKERLARACHALSARAAAPFLFFNCAALTESQAEGELFGLAAGQEGGGGKPGILELARGGTVFLHEVGELSPYMQAKLQRLLIEGCFRRVGDSRDRQTDVRFISATRHDLAGMVAAGRFREDLYYRLNVLSLDVPPLRERGNDVLLLTRHFLAAAARQVSRREPRLSAAAAAALTRQPWPGNVRQLQNCLFQAVVSTDRAVLDVADLPLGQKVTAEETEPTTLEAAVEHCERALLLRLYPRYPSSRKLGERLGVSHTVIALKLKKYGIVREN